MSDLCVSLAGDLRADFYAYRDQPYASQWPHLVAQRITEHRVLTPLAPLQLDEDKRRAVDCYATQVSGLRAHVPAFEAALTEPEQCWRVSTSSP